MPNSDNNRNGNDKEVVTFLNLLRRCSVGKWQSLVYVISGSTRWWCRLFGRWARACNHQLLLMVLHGFRHRCCCCCCRLSTQQMQFTVKPWQYHTTKHDAKNNSHVNALQKTNREQVKPLATSLLVCLNAPNVILVAAPPKILLGKTWHSQRFWSSLYSNCFAEER